MKDHRPQFVSMEQLRIGLFVELDLGWMSHPFPTGSFKISSAKQIETIKTLGLRRVRFVPEKSDLAPEVPVTTAESPSVASEADAGSVIPVIDHVAQQEELLRQQRAEQIALQQRNLAVCDQRFGEAIRHYRKATELLSRAPKLAAEQSLVMIGGFVDELLSDGEAAIRLLSEGVGERAALHPVNVAILSLLLGRATGLTEAEMLDLGMAAFLHDIGKTEVPERLRGLQSSFSASEYKLYQEHVTHSVMLGRRMDLSPGALEAIGQHHEMADGSGFPARLSGEGMTPAAKILALVNRYENLCNPPVASVAITPHEALALIFAQLKSRFDMKTLGAFVRMMGVYPPGSVVQLVDERFAIVVSVNSSRPLKPRVIVHQPDIPKNEALILDLEHVPTVGIRRSLKPSALPKAAHDYLGPRSRVCYFFERSAEPDLHEATA